jgi:hypothetical protein
MIDALLVPVVREVIIKLGLLGIYAVWILQSTEKGLESFGTRRIEQL